MSNLNTGKNRILIHLRYFHSPGDQNSSLGRPYELTQEGISEAVDLSRGRTSEIIRELIEKSLVKKEMARIFSLKRQRDVYTLTKKGLQKSEKIIEKIGNIKITIRKNSKKSEIKLSEIDSYINEKNPILIALNKIKKKDVLDINNLNKRVKDPFVGREEEIRFLFDRLDRAHKGNSVTILIKGKLGIGKTRLLQEFKDRIDVKDTTVLFGKGHYKKLEPFLPFKEAFKSFKTEGNHFPLEFSYPSKTVPQKFDVQEGGNILDKNLVFSKTLENLKNVAEDHTLVLLIDDLQWLDRSSLKFFHFLSRKLEKESILLIGSYRPEDVKRDDFSWGVFQRMHRENIYQELELEPMKLKGTKKIVNSILGIEDIPDELIRSIHEASEGNPLFSKEIIKQMAKDDVIDIEKDKVSNVEGEVKIPKLVKDIIEKRIKKVRGNTLRILQTGCVIGDKVPFYLLDSVVPLDTFEINEKVEKLIDLDIWHFDSEEDVFYFSHGLIRRVIYEDIPKKLREDFHKKVAESLRKESEKDYSKISFHYEKADELYEAVKYYKKAGRRAEKNHDYQNAIKMYKKGYTLADKIEKLKDFELLELIGDLYKKLGEYDQSLEYYEKIPLDNVKEEAKQRIYRKMANIYDWKGDFNETFCIIEKGLDVETEENLEIANLLYRRGWCKIKLGDYDSAEEDFTEAKKISEKFNSKKTLANIYQGLGTVQINKGHSEKALDFLEKVLEIKKELKDFEGQASSLSNIGNIYLNWGDLDKALKYYKRSHDISEEKRKKREIASTLNNMGTIYLKKGELSKSLKHYKRSLEIWEELNDQQGMAISLINVGENYLISENIEESLKNLNKALDISKRINFKKGLTASLANLGKFYYKSDELEKAKNKYKKSLKICYEIGHQPLKPNVFLGLAEIYMKENKLDKAFKYCINAKNLSEKVDSKAEMGLSHKILGIVNRKKGDYDESEKELEKGYDLLSGIGEKRELAELIYHQGVLLKERGKDEEESRDKLSKAKRMFEEMGIEKWVKKCEDVFRRD